MSYFLRCLACNACDSVEIGRTIPGSCYKCGEPWVDTPPLLESDAPEHQALMEQAWRELRTGNHPKGEKPLKRCWQARIAYLEERLQRAEEALYAHPHAEPAERGYVEARAALARTRKLAAEEDSDSEAA